MLSVTWQTENENGSNELERNAPRETQSPAGVLSPKRVTPTNKKLAPALVLRVIAALKQK